VACVLKACGIYRSDMRERQSPNQVDPRVGCRLPLVGPRASVKDATEGARLGSSSAMSSDPAIPRSGCSPALPVSVSPGNPILRCRRKNEKRISSNGNASFPSCLTLGGKPIICVHLRSCAAEFLNRLARTAQPTNRVVHLIVNSGLLAYTAEVHIKLSIHRPYQGDRGSPSFVRGRRSLRTPRVDQARQLRRRAS